MKYLAALLCIVFLSTSSFSQAWVPKGTKWVYHFIPFVPFQSPSLNTITCIDTVMHLGHMCSVLQASQSACTFHTFSNQYLFEEDKKVYIEIDSAFYVLYDFSVEVGDTYWTHFIGFNEVVDSSHIRIIDIDSTIYCGEVKRIFHFEDITGSFNFYLGSNSPIIEGVGSTYFLYPQSGACDPPTGPISCFQRSDCDTTVFGVCLNTTTLPPSPSLVAQVKVYPNPGTDVLYLETELGAELRVFSACGKLMLQKQLTSDKEAVPVKELPNGLYFLQVQEAGGSLVTQKWVKGS
jgi:Secretion system C-terminal sorting domain